MCVLCPLLSGDTMTAGHTPQSNTTYGDYIALAGFCVAVEFNYCVLSINRNVAIQSFSTEELRP